MEHKDHDFVIGELTNELKNLRLDLERRDAQLKIEAEKRDAEAKFWREKFDKRLIPLEELNDKLKTPILVLTWLIGGPIALWVVHAVIQWLDKLWSHIHFR